MNAVHQKIKKVLEEIAEEEKVLVNSIYINWRREANGTGNVHEIKIETES